MAKSSRLILAISAAIMVGTLVFGLYPVGAQERERHGPRIVAPANGATVTGSFTVAYAFGGGDYTGQAEEHHGRRGGMQIFLLVDLPTPEPGSTFQADQTHIAFPQGQTQTTVALAPGKHALQLAILDHEGKIGRHFHGTDPVSIIVQ